MSTPEELVQAAEAAYASTDIERMMALLDPEIAMYWNGRLEGKGIDEVRAWHAGSIFGNLPDGSPKISDYDIRKTLRAATGNVIAVEWEEHYLDLVTGAQVDGFGGEFWWIENDRLVEWHAYQCE